MRGIPDPIEAGLPVYLTTSGDVIDDEDGVLLGYVVHRTSSGTFLLKEGGSAGTSISGTITPRTADNNIFRTFPALCAGGLHASITGTLEATFFVLKGFR